MESVQNDVRELHCKTEGVNKSSVRNRNKSKYMKSSKNTQSNVKTKDKTQCDRCNRFNHSANECWFKDAKCHFLFQEER